MSRAVLLAAMIGCGRSTEGPSSPAADAEPSDALRERCADLPDEPPRSIVARRTVIPRGQAPRKQRAELVLRTDDSEQPATCRVVPAAVFDEVVGKAAGRAARSPCGALAALAERGRALGDAALERRDLRAR